MSEPEGPGPAIVTALTQTATFFRSLIGWRQWLIAFAAGAFSALAFAPIGFFPALLLGYAVLVLLLDGASVETGTLRRGQYARFAVFGVWLLFLLPGRTLQRSVASAARIGWFFGFGQFAAGMYWVGYAFGVDPSEHLWQMPIGIIGLPWLLAQFTALACAAAMFAWRPGAVRVVSLAIAYGIAEWLRGHVLSGFPWNLPGYGWGVSPEILQSTALYGVYGLTFLTVLFGASLALIFSADRRHWLMPGALLGLFIVMWSLGSLRMTFTPVANVPGVSLRLVQPNIPQAEKYLLKYRERNWRRLIDLSKAPGVRPTHLIWPEAAPPFALQQHGEALDEITLLTQGGTVLITGAVRFEERTDTGKRRFFNSLYIFGRASQLIGVYDKFHLVPLGEYVPLEPLLSAIGVSKLVGIGSFDAGDGPHTFHIPGAPPVGPLICYEIIFPAAVTEAGARPGWLVNVSDDSWFGPWAGPRQHLVIARVRAIEEGLPVVRDTNTGISAVIDPVGRIRAQLKMNEVSVLDAELPESLPLTPYARVGDLGFFLLIIIAGGVTLFFSRRN